jgi:hypothetical protein
LVFFGDRQEVMKRATPGKCAYCGGSLEGKKRDSIFCKDACRKAHSRKIQRITTREGEKSRTPAQLNQEVRDAKTVDQGNCITRGPQSLRNAYFGVTGEFAPPVKVEEKTRGAFPDESPSLGALPHTRNTGTLDRLRLLRSGSILK